MEIDRQVEGEKMTVALTGRLDTVTSPELQSVLDATAGVKEYLFDFSRLDYISSAGLRVLLATNKKALAAGGSLTISGANAVVKDVFDMTGFSDILNIV